MIPRPADYLVGSRMALPSEQEHRRRFRERMNRTWDLLQSRPALDFEWRSARPPLAPNGPREQEDARH